MDPMSTNAVTEGVHELSVGVEEGADGSVDDYNDGNGAYIPVHAHFLMLAEQQGWAQGSRRFRDERVQFLQQQFNSVVSDRGLKLEMLQDICRDVGMDPVPDSIRQCKLSLNKVHINICDFIDCQKRGIPIEPVFRNFRQFQSYSLSQRKIFPLGAAKNHDVAKFLLKHLK